MQYYDQRYIPVGVDVEFMWQSSLRNKDRMEDNSAGSA